MARSNRSNIVRLAAPPADTDERCTLSLEATWQVACLFDELAKFAKHLDHPDTIHECSLLRAYVARGQQLSGVIMSMLGHAPKPDDESREVILGTGSAEFHGR